MPRVAFVNVHKEARAEDGIFKIRLCRISFYLLLSRLFRIIIIIRRKITLFIRVHKTERRAEKTVYSEEK